MAAMVMIVSGRLPGKREARSAPADLRPTRNAATMITIHCLGREVSSQTSRGLRCSTGCRSADSAYRAYAGTLATARME